MAFTNSLTDEDLAAAAALAASHPTLSAAAQASGLSENAFRHRVKRAAERGLLGTRPVLPGFVLTGTSAQLGPSGEIEREWVRQGREPGAEFSLPSGHVVKGVSVLTGSDGRELARWTKTREENGTLDLVEALRASFEAYEGRAEPVPEPLSTDADLLSVYPIADQHLGLMAWGRESGENYDLKIGVERLRASARRLIGQSPPSARAIILNLGDWTHADDQRNVTPRSGHQLDVDGRYFKVLMAGIRLMQDVIEMALARHGSVLLRNIPGNHDPHAAMALTAALGAFYANEPRVEVDLDPSEFFYHRFGQTLIGANHGHRLKPADMAMNMAVRRREDWGATRYHWFLFGHIHHETAKEVGDVRCESFQTLASKDAYSAGGGYVSGMSLTSVTLHREDGEIGRHRVNVPPPGV